MAFVYSCCFWFSLRLGGILIGIFSMALLLLIIWCLSYKHSNEVKDVVSDWINNLQLGYYMKMFLENIRADPQGYCSIAITFTCIYIFLCILFIYGAYTVSGSSWIWELSLFNRKFNNVLMIAYLLTEAARLILSSIMTANFLLLLKENTMDIGLLIGASVAGGFLLLGMFYLLVCAINLPILINEMKLDEQAATINKLQQLLEANNQRSFTNRDDSLPYIAEYSTGEPRNKFKPRYNMYDN